ncbi:hypothetical protein [Micromonospora yangpuensis]|uniref:Uncharacterized protein n=1 Tax=Micromonospora yangpuensis TaxID=683228 RepID=A0A1C6U4I0_9ACTN|nr:hypothetical protein [Micromonospora yangpuensis]GGL93011.1 hypothetical protein GCM10012279_08410 [Micromonospora yangpuensis]SCL48779.1 hypothetical protein GA0070617_0976 [Micromonospora yangpuensis]
MSSTSSNTLAYFLLDLDEEIDVAGWGEPVTLLLIHTRPSDTGNSALACVEFPLHPYYLGTSPAGLPRLLRRITADLTDPTGGTAHQVTLAAILDGLLGHDPAAMILAWAVVHHDPYQINGEPRTARRITAVDTGRRLFSLTQPEGSGPWLRVSPGLPEPTDEDTVSTGLAALLTAASRHASRHARQPAAPPAGEEPADPRAPIFVLGPDDRSLMCLVCGALEGITCSEMPSMAGYGRDTYTRCGRCGSIETTDPILGIHITRAPWPVPPATTDGDATP